MKKRLPPAAWILIVMLIGIILGRRVFTNFPDKKAASQIAGYISITVRRVPAPDQDADRPARVLDAGGGHRAHGRAQVGGPRVRRGAGLVHHRFADLADPLAKLVNDTFHQLAEDREIERHYNRWFLRKLPSGVSLDQPKSPQLDTILQTMAARTE